MLAVPMLLVRLMALVLLICHSIQGALVLDNLYTTAEQLPQSNDNLPTESLYNNNKQQQQFYQPELSLYDQPQPQPQQQQIENLLQQQQQQGYQDNLKRYLLKAAQPQTNVDLDLDGYTLKQPPVEQWRLIRLNQLLENLSSSIPSPSSAPIFRNSRTFPSSSSLIVSPSAALAADPKQQGNQNSRQVASISSGANNFANNLSVAPNSVALQIQPQGKHNSRSSSSSSSSSSSIGTSADLLDQLQETSLSIGGGGNSNSINYTTGNSNNKGVKAPRRSPNLLGIVWQPNGGRTQSASGGGGGNFINVRRSQTATNSKGSPHHSVGTEEVALNTPMHARSISDYEWKRVENSKWNNLRGMWGKRASSSDLSNKVDEQQQQQQQQQQQRNLLATGGKVDGEYRGSGHGTKQQQQQQLDDTLVAMAINDAINDSSASNSVALTLSGLQEM